MSATSRRLGLSAKLFLYARLWAAFVIVWITMRRSPLPDAVARLGEARPRRGGLRLAPNRYGTIVGRALQVGPLTPRCIFRALVLYRELRRQGDAAELVIGLPIEAVDKDAHAWVEIGGHDVGPPPGRGRHQPLARYP